MLQRGEVLTGVVPPSPHTHLTPSNTSRPLGQCRQVAIGDLHSPQARSRQPVDMLNQQNGLYRQKDGIYSPQGGNYSPETNSFSQQGESSGQQTELYSQVTGGRTYQENLLSGHYGTPSKHHDNTYVSMTDFHTSFHTSFPALCDSLDSYPHQHHQHQLQQHPQHHQLQQHQQQHHQHQLQHQHHQQQQQQQQQPYMSDISSSSSSSLENSVEAPRQPNRKRKRPYVPHVQRKLEVVVKRNARERRRMGNLQGAFRTLQKHLPVVKHSSKRIPKEKLLRVATDYIRHLQVILQHPELLQGQESILIPQLSFLPQSTDATTASPASVTSPTSPSMTSPTSPSITSPTSPFMTSPSPSLMSVASPVASPTSSPGSTSCSVISPRSPTSSPRSPGSCLPAGTSPPLTSPIPSPETMVASPADSDVLREDVKVSHPYVMTPEGQEVHLDLSPAVLEFEEFAFLDKAEMKSLFSW